MSRHPYTYACDFIRSLGPFGENGTVLSRSEASRIRQGIAKAIGMDDEELAIKLSEAEQAKTEADHKVHTDRMIQAFARRTPII